MYWVKYLHFTCSVNTLCLNFAPFSSLTDQHDYCFKCLSQDRAGNSARVSGPSLLLLWLESSLQQKQDRRPSRPLFLNALCSCLSSCWLRCRFQDVSLCQLSITQKFSIYFSLPGRAADEESSWSRGAPATSNRFPLKTLSHIREIIPTWSARRPRLDARAPLIH